MRLVAFRRAFTLIELLVVISIIALLISILVPSLNAAKGLAKEAKCLANIHAQVRGVWLYAEDHDNALACGSSDPLLYPGQGPLEPINSLATFQFWLAVNQQPSGQGLLLPGNYMPEMALFCPTDEAADADEQLNRFRTRSTSRFAWSSYLYRQLDGQKASPSRWRLDDLGNNGKDKPVKVLVLDMQQALKWTDLPLKSNHAGRMCGAGFAAGNARMLPNEGERFTLNGHTSNTYPRLDQILEAADALAD